MSRANEVFDYERRLKCELRNLERDKINGSLLHRYYLFSVAEGISLARVIKRLSHLRILSRTLGRELDKATKDQIVELVAWVERADYSQWTKRDYKLVLRKFFQWLRGSEQGKYPPEVSWMKIHRAGPSSVMRQDLLTWEEVQRILNFTTNTRDRAFIMVLFDAGLRISEILPLRIEDVEFGESGGVLYTDGKTGKSLGIIGWSVPALASWMDAHPFKENPKAPLWCELGKTEPKMVKYRTEIVRLKKIARRAGIKKRVWNHLFKHTAATRDSKKLPSALMNLKYHWKQNSEMPSYYVHLSGEDIAEVQHLLYGSGEKKTTGEVEIKMEKCPRCSLPVSPGSSFCNKCGLALDSKGELDFVNRVRRIDELLNLVTSDPAKRRQLARLLQP